MGRSKRTPRITHTDTKEKPIAKLYEDRIARKSTQIRTNLSAPHKCGTKYDFYK